MSALSACCSAVLLVSDVNGSTVCSKCHRYEGCCYCGAPVTSTDPDVIYCRDCYYSGAPLNDDFSALIEELPTTMDGAGWKHTGGGCFVLEVPLGDGWLWASEDQGGAAPATEDGPWWVFRYGPDMDAFLDGDDEGTMVGEHLDRDGLLAAIEAEASR